MANRSKDVHREDYSSHEDPLAQKREAEAAEALLVESARGIFEVTKERILQAKEHTQAFLQEMYVTRVIALAYTDKVLMKVALNVTSADSSLLLFVHLVSKKLFGTTKLTLKNGEMNKNSVRVGEHMTVRKTAYRGEKRILANGEVLLPKDMIGEIDFVRDFPTLPKNGNLFAFTREIFRSAHESLEELAWLCSIESPQLEGVDVFHGISHLAGPLAERLGFDTFEITNPRKLSFHKWSARVIAERYAGKNEEWKAASNNFKAPREAFISRTELMKLFWENKRG